MNNVVTSEIYKTGGIVNNYKALLMAEQTRLILSDASLHVG